MSTLGSWKCAEYGLPVRPELIVCLRHGEKPLDASGNEIDDQPGLSRYGAQRAKRLADALRPGALLPDGTAEPSRFFVPDYDDGPALHRSYQTVQPLASRLNTCPTALSKKDDVDALIDAVRESEPVVVICWAHEHLVAWLQQLASEVTVEHDGSELPSDWDNGRFDVLWLLEQRQGQQQFTYRFRTQNQALMPGDTDFLAPTA